MVTKFDPRMIGDGVFKLSQNLRYDQGLPVVRDGTVVHTASAPAGMTAGTRPFAGAYECSLANSNCAFVAWYGTVSGVADTIIYNIANGTQTEVTGTTGRFGNTRFGNSLQQPHYFTTVRDEESGLDYLVIQGANGTDYPRVYSKDTGVMAIHQPITPPVDGGLYQTVHTWPHPFVVGGSGTMPSYTNSGANLVAATTGSSPDRNVRLTRNSTPDAGPATALLTFSATVDLSTDRMLCMVLDQSNYNFWPTYLKIEIHDSVAGYTTVYDGQDTTGKYSPVYAPLDSSTSRVQVGFLLDGIPAASRDVVDGIRFTWNNTTAVPSSSVTLDILCCAGSGAVPGLSQHAVTYCSTDSRAESITVYPNNQTSELLGGIGGRPLQDTRIAVQPYFYYAYTLYYQNIDNTQLAQGVDTLRIYRQDFDEVQYTLTHKITTASWNGSAWVLTSGSGGSQLSYTDNNAPSTRSLWITPPRQGHTCLPRGGAMASTNNRLFVATYAPSSGSTQGGLSELCGSEFKFPFRFAYGFVGNDYSQPSRASYPGEQIRNMVATSLSGGNVMSIYVFTDRSLNMVDGLDAFALSMRKRVAPLGMISPWAWTEDNGRIFWLDQLLQVRMLTARGLQNISRAAVDDQLLSISQTGNGGSQVQWVAMGFSNERLYLGFSTNGVSNNNCLVFDITRMRWISADAAPSSMTYEGFIRDLGASGTRIPLLVLSSDQKAYRYDQPGQTQDLGSNIAVQLQTRDYFASELWADECAMVINRMRIECDDAAGGSFTFTVTYRPTGSTRASTISTDVTSPRAYRYDDPSTFTMKDSAGLTEASGGSPVPVGNAANIVVAASLPGGTRIYDLAFEFERRDGVADVG